jgi:hypothetical protein
MINLLIQKYSTIYFINTLLLSLHQSFQFNFNLPKPSIHNFLPGHNNNIITGKQMITSVPANFSQYSLNLVPLYCISNILFNDKPNPVSGLFFGRHIQQKIFALFFGSDCKNVSKFLTLF